MKINIAGHQCEIGKIYKKRAMVVCPFHTSQKGTADLDVTLEGKYAGYFRCWSCEASGKIDDETVCLLRKARGKVQTKKPSNISEAWESMKPGGLSRVDKPFKVSDNTMIKLEWKWDGLTHCFPEKNGCGDIIGILRRFPDGNKGVYSGSKRGLTIPRTNFDATKPLYVTEGLSDLSVILECGLQGVARPNSNSGNDLLTAWLAHTGSPDSQIVIVTDNDDPGLDGASELWSLLESEGYNNLTAITPEENDLRDMYESQGLERTKQWLSE